MDNSKTLIAIGLVFSSIACSKENHGPIASAGDDRSGGIGDRIVFDGSGSSDPDSDALTYSWRIVESAQPDLVISGHSASLIFYPEWTGRYVFELTVSDGIAESVDEVSADINCGAPQRIESWSDDLSDWTNVKKPSDCVDYQVTADVIAPLGHIWTIAPGTRIAVDRGVQLRTEGAQLFALGTAEEPIWIGGSESGRGAWKGISLRDSQEAQFDHVTIQDGEANVTAESGTVLTMDHSTSKNSNGYGLVMDQEANFAGFYQNELSGNREGPIQVHLWHVRDLPVENQYAGNDVDVVRVTGTNQNLAATWSNLGVPYLVGDSGSNVVTFSNETLIEAGVVMQFMPDTGLEIQFASLFTAQGESGKPVRFTGRDTAPGSWRGIAISESAQAVFDQVIVENGGGGEPWSASQAMAERANISVLASDPGTSVALSNVALMSSMNNALWIEQAPGVDVACTAVSAENPIDPACPYSYSR